MIIPTIPAAPGLVTSETRGAGLRLGETLPPEAPAPDRDRRAGLVAAVTLVPVLALAAWFLFR